MRYSIGLDIGITSVGWAILALNDSNDPVCIVDMGSRIFDIAEHPKDGSSLATPRRLARGSRRTTRRRSRRKEKIRNLLVSDNIISREQLDSLFSGKLEDIYMLRTKALDVPLDRAEFARVLLHLAQRRGFKSNRKNNTTTEDGKLLNAITDNAALMTEKGYRTIGEMFFKDEMYSDKKRNSAGDYKATVSRDLIENEAKTIFAAQRSFGCDFASEETESKYLEILLKQLNFDEGPESGPYSGNLIEKMRGICEFFPEEKRAAKASFSFQYFNLLQKINNIRLISEKEELSLDDEQRSLIKVLALKKDSITFSDIRKALELDNNVLFNIPYPKEKGEDKVDIQKCEKMQKFQYLKEYHKIKKALGENFATFENRLDEIGEILTCYKTDRNIEKALFECGFTEEETSLIKTLDSFTKFGHLSLKALKMIIPHLEGGMVYSDACKAAGISFNKKECEKQMLLHCSDDILAPITSPVAKRAISQTIKVINSIIRRQGESPTFINIELARELAKSKQDRDKIKKSQDENMAENEKIIQKLKDHFHISDPRGDDIIKLKLWEKQDGVCLYSGQKIEYSRLLDSNYTQIDHIVPYSQSFDNSYNNKVLVFASENQNKRNRLPLQYLEGKKRDDFIVRVNNMKQLDPKKKRNLLRESFDLSEEEMTRHLQDTQTISTFLRSFIEDNLIFSNVKGKKQHVRAINGRITAYVRSRWGISKVRANGDLHHAVDAVVIACITPSMINQISRYSKYKETNDISEYGGNNKSPHFPEPWNHFRKELDARLSSDAPRAIRDLGLATYSELNIPSRQLFVSRMPKRKASGEAHEATLRRFTGINDKGKNVVVTKTPLSELKLENGEIKDYYNEKSDQLLYDALKKRLLDFGGDGKKAFPEGYVFRKPKSDGSEGPIVKSVKLITHPSLYVDVQENKKGVADNGKMIRTDVFKVENDGYYLVPIYVSDTVKDELPNISCGTTKKEMKEEDFLFSLYPNDLVKITSKKEISLELSDKESDLPTKTSSKSWLVYYKSTDIAVGSIGYITHDNAYKSRTGVKTLLSIEKYTVDVLGEYHRVEKEKRLTFSNKKK